MYEAGAPQAAALSPRRWPGGGGTWKRAAASRFSERHRRHPRAAQQEGRASQTAFSGRSQTTRPPLASTASGSPESRPTTIHGPCPGAALAATPRGPPHHAAAAPPLPSRLACRPPASSRPALRLPAPEQQQQPPPTSAWESRRRLCQPARPSRFLGVALLLRGPRAAVVREPQGPAGGRRSLPPPPAPARLLESCTEGEQEPEAVEASGGRALRFSDRRCPRAVQQEGNLEEAAGPGRPAEAPPGFPGRGWRRLLLLRGGRPECRP
uniref:Uncharacterized protein n=1 Tax=Sphaerodactylus townsendi TaxID=933632 RepID=A0ACB8E8G6_9SAUR